MTKHNEARTAAVLLSGTAASSAYSHLIRGAQAPMARVLRDRQPVLFLGQQLPPKSEGFDAQWLYITSAVLVRRFDYAESPEIIARDLDLWMPLQLGSAASPAKIVLEAKSLGRTKIALKFRPTNSGVLIPRVPTEHVVKQQADVFAMRLYEIARDNPDLVRAAVMHFVQHVNTENRLIVSLGEEMYAVQRWVEMVNCAKLKIQAVGFKLAKEDHNCVRSVLRSLHLRKLEKTMVWRRAPNSKYLEKIGLHVVCELPRRGKTISCSSEAFRFVMASAAIARIWEQAQESIIEKCPPEVAEPVPDGQSQQVFAF